MRTRIFSAVAASIFLVGSQANATIVAVNIGSNFLPDNGTFTLTAPRTFSSVDYDNNTIDDHWNDFGFANGSQDYTGIHDLAGNLLSNVIIRADGVQGANPNDAFGADATAWSNAFGVPHENGLNGIMHSLYWDWSISRSYDITLKGLGVGSKWDVEVFAGFSNSNPANDQNFYSVNGSSSQTIDMSEAQADSDAARLVFSGIDTIAADGGTLVINVSGDDTDPGGYGAHLYAVRLTAVPEPASFGALTLIGLGMFVRRRR